MLILSHPSGNANVRQALQALEERGLLAEYVTFFATLEGNSFDRLARWPAFAEFERRRLPPAFKDKCAQKPWPEIGRLLAQKLGIQSLLGHESGFFCPDKNNIRLGHFAASRLRRRRHDVRGVYCYEDTALETFRAATVAGAKKIYDLPIGYWRAAKRILEEEAERRPEWRATMPGLQDSEQKKDRKDEELATADAVLAASSFTRKTLEDAPFGVKAVSVIPYGADDMDCANERRYSSKGPLRVLFVGSLSQRKGIADLFDACDAMAGAVELTLVGSKPSEDCAALNTALRKHRWIPSMSRAAIMREMQRNDVFVFPSLFEGFGLVITESLSQGLPVITTSHTCGPDVLAEGKDGFIVPTSSPTAIVERLEYLYSNRDLLASMGQAAIMKARALSWPSYRRGVADAVCRVLN